MSRCARARIRLPAGAAVGTGRVAAGRRDRSPRAGRARRGSHRRDWPHERRCAATRAEDRPDSRARITLAGQPSGCPGDHARGDRREAVSRPAAPGREQLPGSDADAHLQGLDGRLLSDLRDRAEHVRCQLAAAGLDPSPGVGVLDSARHLPRSELRSLLRRSDAVQRHQRRVSHPVHVGSGRRLLRLRKTTRALRPHDERASLDLRRLRRDHGRRASAVRRWGRIRARRICMGRRLRLLRPRCHGCHLRRSGARARDRLVPARLLHQLRAGTEDARSGAGRLRRACARRARSAGER